MCDWGVFFRSSVFIYMHQCSKEDTLCISKREYHFSGELIIRRQNPNESNLNFHELKIKKVHRYIGHTAFGPNRILFNIWKLIANREYQPNEKQRKPKIELQ